MSKGHGKPKHDWSSKSNQMSGTHEEQLKQSICNLLSGETDGRSFADKLSMGSKSLVYKSRFLPQVEGLASAT